MVLDRESPEEFRLLLDDQGGESYLYDYSSDLSEGGLFVHTGRKLPRGARVRVSFTLPDSVDLIQAECEVRWTASEGEPQGPGLGLEFRGLGETARRSLLRFIRKNL